MISDPRRYPREHYLSRCRQAAWLVAGVAIYFGVIAAAGGIGAVAGWVLATK